jgi:hypothetical protein
MSENTLKIKQYFAILLLTLLAHRHSFNLSAYQLKTTNSNKRFHQLFTPSQSTKTNDMCQTKPRLEMKKYLIFAPKTFKISI